MQTRCCDQECAYFKWSEHGANYKAYCLKSSKHVKEMGVCPIKWASRIKEPESQVAL